VEDTIMLKKCKVCGLDFEPSHIFQLKCSDDCKKIAARNSRNEYKKTDAGKASIAKYKKSPAGISAKKRQQSTELSKELHREVVKQFHERNKENDTYMQPRRESQKRMIDKDKESYLSGRRDYYHNVLKKNVSYLINHRMADGIRKSLRNNKKGKWLGYVDYSVEELWTRLLDTMPSGYTVEDFISGELHIDHIYPMSKFDIQSPQDEGFTKCWALGNLRLLPAIENIRKSNKVLNEN
jgi:hypothetical protein